MEELYLRAVASQMMREILRAQSMAQPMEVDVEAVAVGLLLSLFDDPRGASPGIKERLDGRGQSGRPLPATASPAPRYRSAAA